MPKEFHFPYFIAMYDTDSAGQIFFANLHRVTDGAYEAFLREIGFGLDVLFKKRTLAMPVVHLEGDFQKILRAGDRVDIIVRVAHLGRTSYRMAYEVHDESGELCATAATVQVCVDPQTHEPMEIPGDLRKALENWKG
jgi:1,4-dihydroxy-2-naphthoyl-CoA hydrolase